MSAPELYAEAGRRGLSIPLAAFRARLGGEPALKKMLSSLTVVEKVTHGRPKHMARETRRAYAVDRAADRLYIPRIKAGPLMKARTTSGAPLLDGIRPAADALPAPRALAPTRCVLTTPLYPYQAAALAHLCAATGPLMSAAGVAYLQMDTGLGKTRLGVAIIAHLGVPTLVVVPTKSIAQQWLDECAEVAPALATALYQSKGPRQATTAGPATKDVVVVIINTFRDKTPDFLAGYGMVILDEAHEYCSPINLQALWLSQTRHVLGLSATPDEAPSGLDRYVMMHLGPPILAAGIPGFDASDVRFRGEVKIVEYAGTPEYCTQELTAAGTMSAIKTIIRICSDPARARLVAAEILALARAHETGTAAELARAGLGPRPASAATPNHPEGEIRRHGVFCFAELRETLIEVRAALLATANPPDILAPELDDPLPPTDVSSAGLGLAAADDPSEPEDGSETPPDVSPQRISVLRGGIAAADVGHARRARAHIVLTTYGFSRRGVSLPDMTAIVAITPRRNGTRQLLGRFLRRGSDESIVRQMVDIVDVRTGLKSQVADRIKVYKEKKYPIRRVRADWTEYAATDSGQSDSSQSDPRQPAASTEAASREVADNEQELSGLTLDDLLSMAMGTD